MGKETPVRKFKVRLRFGEYDENKELRALESSSGAPENAIVDKSSKMCYNCTWFRKPFHSERNSIMAKTDANKKKKRKKRNLKCVCILIIIRRGRVARSVKNQMQKGWCE